MAGIGHYPFKSAWAFRRGNLISTDSVRTQVVQPQNTAGVAIWTNWWFDSGSGPVYSGVLKRWTGAAWEKAKLLVWSGAAWVAKPLKRWTGSTWAEVDATGV